MSERGSEAVVVQSRRGEHRSENGLVTQRLHVEERKALVRGVEQAVALVGLRHAQLRVRPVGGAAGGGDEARQQGAVAALLRCENRSQ